MYPETLVEAILVAGLDDWVMLLEVESLARRDGGESSSDELVDVIEAMAGDGLVQIGDVRDPDGFVSWELSPADAAKRIRSEWSTLARSLGLGDICWLSNTALGDERARQILGE